MGERFWSCYLANKVRAHLASFLTGLLTILVPGLFWFWYLTNKDNIVPLLAPLASLMTGLLTVTVAGFAARIALRQAKTAADQAEAARERHEEQTKADLQRRITESFTKVVEQLGSDKLQVRLGGIYTLERISLESDSDYWTIMEMLTGFVRERARWNGKDIAVSRPCYVQKTPQQPDIDPPTDIAAVLTVIKRHEDRNLKNFEREQSKGWRFDLRSTDLRGAHLVMAR